ncbi:MAG: hypothetical protein JOZ55_09070 [Alphaproteobacteria bacterium]|nr:hypothetical protein [Alphaproteobacteria bacterium]
MTDKHEDLSPSERVQRYRTLADEANARAQSATNPELRESYLQLAQGWTSLADQLDGSGTSAKKR